MSLLVRAAAFPSERAGRADRAPYSLIPPAMLSMKYFCVMEKSTSEGRAMMTLVAMSPPQSVACWPLKVLSPTVRVKSSFFRRKVEARRNSCQRLMKQ